MTTVAYKDGIIACDTRVIQGSTIMPTVYMKIAKSPDGWLGGGSGNITFLAEFLAWIEDGCVWDKRPKLEEGDRGFVVSPNGKIHVVESGGTFSIDAEYTAIGSGKEFAYGAMHAGATAIDAVMAAVSFDPGSGAPIRAMAHD